MAKVTRTNPNIFSVVAKGLDALDGLQAKAGWFQSAVYQNGKPVAYIAMIQEYGATISHPGGTPYIITSDGMAKFVSKSSPQAAGLPVTKAHTITIPPRPFMRPTVSREKNNWLKMLENGAKAVLSGKISAKDVLDTVAARAAKDIAKTIASIQSPPLARSTIQKRIARKSSKAVTATLTKPLVDTGMMITSVTHVVEKAE